MSEANGGEIILAAYALMKLLEQHPESLEDIFSVLIGLKKMLGSGLKLF